MPSLFAFFYREKNSAFFFIVEPGLLGQFREFVSARARSRMYV